MFKTPLRCVIILAAIVGLERPASSQEPAHPSQVSYPATGKRSPLLEPLDSAVVTMMATHGIPGGALAVAKDGKLVFARGYGWANLATEELVQPDTLFGVASLSKTITAVAILKLVEQGKLSLEGRPFEILRHIQPPPKSRVDPRLYRITVRQLLNHSGGWDHQKSGDPVNWTTQMHLKRKDRTPVSAEGLISRSMSLPLDFEPGTDSKYSNFGYIVLGEVIERVAGMPYGKYVHEQVLAPAGMRRTSLHSLGGRYFENEARRYLAGNDTELPSWQQQYSDAAGGWTASAVDMIRLLTALDGSRGKPLLDEKTFRLMIEPSPTLRPRADGTHVGLGWDKVVLTDKGYGYFKDGLWHGMRAFMIRGHNGVNAVLLFNVSMQPDVLDKRIVDDAVQQIRRKLEEIEKYPDFDLFGEFRS
jgi:N-acyl-D-amino-acid deacylase